MLISVLRLCACDRSDSMDGTAKNMIVPEDAKRNKSLPGESGDEGIQREKKGSGDEGIQSEPINPNSNPNVNPAIIIPPPIVNMPADIVPEKTR